jgi:hypothetical protein
VQHRALDALVDGVARADQRQPGEDEIRSVDRRDDGPLSTSFPAYTMIGIPNVERYAVPSPSAYDSPSRSGQVSGDRAAEERRGVEGLPRRQVVT